MPVLTTASGEAISYGDCGAGPVVVLVHGSPGNGKAWQRVSESLSPRFRVIAPTLPGTGESTPSPARDQSISYVAGLIEALTAEVGVPAVLAGHSHGGVVALAVALRGRVKPRALALFEPVAISILDTVGERDLHARAKVVFDDYIARVAAGDAGAVRTMVGYWFGAGAFERMPPAMTQYLLDHAAHNVRDVGATFRERYTAEAIRALAMPVALVRGGRSPEVTLKISGALASLAPQGSLTTLDGATHALITTHAEAVAGVIAGLAAKVSATWP